jgi:hypothetical protein
MSKRVDKTSGKEFKITTHTQLSASLVAGNGIIDGRPHEFVGIDKVPSRFKSGDQASFVDLDAIDTGSGIIRDTVRGIVYTPFQKRTFQAMQIGDTRPLLSGDKGKVSFISQSFDRSAYLQISSSFAKKFSSVPDTTPITVLMEEFYSGSITEGFVGQVTASFNTFTPDGLTSSFSGIDTGNGYDMTFDFSDSNFVTNLLISFVPGGEANILRTSTFIPKFQHRFTHAGSNRTNKALMTSSLASVNGVLGLDAAAVSPPSGSDCGVGVLINVNGVNANAGTYAKNVFKGRVGGDADSGSIAAVNNDLLVGKEYVIYPRGTVVASASYHFLPNTGTFVSTAARAAAVTSSATIKEVFFASGSTNDTLGRVGGAHTGSGIEGVQSGFGGSLAHADPLLRTTASMGFYCLSGSQGGTAVIINVITSSIDNGGNNLGSNEMKIPRFTNKVPL